MSQSRQQLYYWHESNPSKAQWTIPTWESHIAEVYGSHLKASDDLYMYRSCMNFCKSAYLELWLKKLVSPSTSSILDLACGKGGDVQKVQDFALYFGMDVSPSSIEEAKRRYPGKTFQVSSFNSPLKVKNFDAVICMLALHYAENISQTMKYISDTLKPGGYFLCMVLDWDMLHKHPNGIEPMKVHSWERSEHNDSAESESFTHTAVRLSVSLEGTMTALPEWLLHEEALKQDGLKANLKLVKSCNVLQGLATEFGWSQWLDSERDERYKAREDLLRLHAQHYKKIAWDTRHWDFVSQYKVYMFQKF